MVPLFTVGALNADGEIVRDPTLPDLPSFPEVYEAVHGKKPSGPAWEAWQAFFLSGYATQKFLMVPKETPDDIVQAYRDAAKKMAADPQVVAFIHEELGKYETIVDGVDRSEEHTSELQSLMRISYAVFCLKKKKTTQHTRLQP